MTVLLIKAFRCSFYLFRWKLYGCLWQQSVSRPAASPVTRRKKSWRSLSSQHLPLRICSQFCNIHCPLPTGRSAVCTSVNPGKSIHIAVNTFVSYSVELQGSWLHSLCAAPPPVTPQWVYNDSLFWWIIIFEVSSICLKVDRYFSKIFIRTPTLYFLSYFMNLNFIFINFI